VKSDPPNDRPLTADEVEADPSILRNPGVREKTRNRSGQGGGASKTQLNFPFAWRSIEMMKSPAYNALGLAARRVLDRLEIEFEKHGRNPLENGLLPCTFDDFQDYGIDRHAIAPAIREAVALGFVRITRKGSAGNESRRQAALYLITYRHAGSDCRLEDGWKAVKTLEEARNRVKSARRAKADPRASEFGKRGAAASRAKAAAEGARKQTPSGGSPTDPSVGGQHWKGPFNPPLEVDFPVGDSAPLSRVSPGRALPATVWAIEGSYQIGGRRFEEFARPRHVVRDGWRFQ
jgi:hypothetical protein